MLATLAGLVANEEVQRRTTSAMVRLINPADWGIQLRLVEQLTSCLGSSLPRYLVERPTESLVSAYRELIALLLQTESFLGASRHTTETPRTFRPLRE